jgi:hypothetical protein
MMTMAKPRLNLEQDFVRYEFKFFLDQLKREEVESEIANFMSFDGHVHPELDNAYFVRSLYFDNDLNSYYYEKIDGIKERRKFRIRTYGKSFESGLPVYLEEKNRDGDRVQKHRVEIDPGHLSAVCDPGRDHDLQNLLPKVNLVERFLFDAMRRSLKPKVLIDYVRRPYVSSYDMNFRVTFDSVFMSTATNVLFPPQWTNWKHSHSGFTVLEVKFFRRIPAWFHRIIQAHNLKRISFSKFCKGMETTGLAVDLS